MLAGARVDVNDQKRNPFDFALWKASKEGEPWWESPWGRGRPGWHLECSVMSQRYLGETFDIHGGGEDLIFPHHENEIAQSEGATLARYWVHNGFVRVNSEKMSKSLGNFFTIRDILQQYHPEVLRLFLLQSHYRSPVDFSDAALNEARQGMNRFYTMLKALKEFAAGETAPVAEPAGKDAEMTAQLQALRERFVDAMDDDFNTARAIGHLFDVVRLVNTVLAEKKPGVSRGLFGEAGKTLLEIGSVLGFFLEEPDVYLCRDREREAAKRGLAVAEIERLIAERRAARAAKAWQRADEIRKELSGLGVLLQDGPDATTWTIA
jgi:cysteinyl-tRNA synthetase